MVDTRVIAQSKIDRALAKIEKAQILLSEAAAELCPIYGMLSQWEHVGDLYDKVKAGWHFVNQNRHSSDVDLDAETKYRLEQKASEG